MADITLINLNMLFVRYSDKYDQERHVPLGPLYLVSVLEGAGFAVDFRDYQDCQESDPFDLERFVSFCSDPAPVIGLSCMANLLPFTILAARALKKRCPSSTIVLGGVGAKSVESIILERFEWIDIIAHGEGEQMVVSLLEALKNDAPLGQVPGIFFRDPVRGEIVGTSPAPQISDLSDIPLPAYHRIDLDSYDAYGMVSSRGCPYKCTFCSVAPVWNHKCRYRTAEDVVAEMVELNRAAGVELFLFQDEFFVSSKKAVLRFCEQLEKTGLKVSWKAFSRVDLADREMMSIMARAGCVEIRFGIESGSPRMLELTRKGFDPTRAAEVVSLATQIFPRVDTFFIWGYPDETMQDFYQSLLQMVSFRLMGARVLPSLLCLLPQTEIYRQIGKERFAQAEFCEELFPEYMITGHEICDLGTVSIHPTHRPFFDLVKQHRDIFPGFFLLDLETNIRPKLRLLQEQGFYSRPDRELAAETMC